MYKLQNTNLKISNTYFVYVLWCYSVKNFCKLKLYGFLFVLSGCLAWPAKDYIIPAIFAIGGPNIYINVNSSLFFIFCKSNYSIRKK